MNFLKKFYVLIFISLLGNSCAQTNDDQSVSETELKINDTIVLMDFFRENKKLDSIVDAEFETMNAKSRVAQLIMPATGRLGKPKEMILQHIQDTVIGGILMLNGTTTEFTNWIIEFDSINKSYGGLPFLYSADAEPSLVNRKIAGTKTVKKANELDSIQEVHDVALSISNDLNAIGINYNFSPVVDMSPNKTVGFRSFGKNPKNIIPWSSAFIKTTQSKNIIATAKHFPGHGLVTGDTHKSLQMIDGELKEIKNYPDLIADSVLSVMVAHIAVKNNEKYNTQGLPSTCSEKIVTDLLKNELGFKGLIVTDAMNMGGVVSVKNSNVKAINAGCDILLMPLDAKKAHQQILTEYHKNELFRKRVDESAKKIVRMKVSLGLIK